jgi:hypothetical protein
MDAGNFGFGSFSVKASPRVGELVRHAECVRSTNVDRCRASGPKVLALERECSDASDAPPSPPFIEPGIERPRP